MKDELPTALLWKARGAPDGARGLVGAWVDVQLVKLAARFVAVPALLIVALWSPHAAAALMVLLIVVGAACAMAAVILALFQ